MREQLLQRAFWRTATIEQVREQLKGKDPTALRCPDTGANPLHFACEQCPDPKVIQVLVNHGFDVNMRDWHWLAVPLHDAARHNPNADVIRVLVKAGAHVDGADRSGQTPLHLAAAHNESLDVARALIESEADVNARDNRDETPLHYAAMWSRREMIRLLIDAGADNNLRNVDGRTPQEVLSLSLRRSAPTSRGQKGSMNKGEWIEHRGVWKTATLERLCSKLLSEYGAYFEAPARAYEAVNMRGWEGVPQNGHWALRALRDAAWGNPDPGVIRALVGAGADVNARDDCEATPLHKAAAHNPNPGVARALIELGANVNAREFQDYTPLHLAAGHNPNPEVARVLVELGADVNALSNIEGTPLHYAAHRREQDYEAIAALLVSLGADENSRAFAGLTPKEVREDDW